MVKFGRHLQFYLECEEPHREGQYIVPYNQLRDQIFSNKSPEDASIAFEVEWRQALHLASQDFNKSTTYSWRSVFEGISDLPQARGAELSTALKLYVATVGISISRDMLVFLKSIRSNATVNSEALRKLVKKFDKNTDTKLSARLLPELYATAFTMGQNSLDLAIDVLRELLEDGSNYCSDHDESDSELEVEPRCKSSVRHLKYSWNETKEDQVVSRRADEVRWLQRTTSTIPPTSLKHIVAHRGFHYPSGRSDVRPLENSLNAFEMAWTSGIQLCECDVALTKDEKLVLAHDEDYSRLALDPFADQSRQKVKDLTYKELIALTLKNGVRAPLLLDVLRSAKTIGCGAQLIVEIKPGNSEACSALVRLFQRHPELVECVAVVMSFDVWAMHQLRKELETVRDEICRSQGNDLFEMEKEDEKKQSELCEQISTTTTTLTSNSTIYLPKLMLLTVADPPETPYELWVDVNDFSPIDSWLQHDDRQLDGVYLRFQTKMLEPEGIEALRALSQRYTVGVWALKDVDPDNYETLQRLMKAEITFYNTDLPRDFIGGKNNVLIN